MELLRTLAIQLVGMNLPYIWGGKLPLVGLDCSGVTQWILQSVGIGPTETLNSQGQFNYWEKHGRKLTEPELGALIFFGRSPTEIKHVAFCIDYYRMVEASGGTDRCTSLPKAVYMNAMIRMNPIHRRKDIQGIFLPNYSMVGLK